MGKGKRGAQENKFDFALDKGEWLCSYVFMSDTKHISMRIDAEILALVDAEAKRMRWSRNAALNTCVEFGLVDLEMERGPSGGKLNGKEKVAEVAAEKAGEIGRENGPAGIQGDRAGGKGGSSRPSEAGGGEVSLNAEIATGGSAGVAADSVLPEGKPSVRKGDSYINRELLSGDAPVKGWACGFGGIPGIGKMSARMEKLDDLPGV